MKSYVFIFIYIFLFFLVFLFFYLLRKTGLVFIFCLILCSIFNFALETFHLLIKILSLSFDLERSLHVSITFNVVPVLIIPLTKGKDSLFQFREALAHKSGIYSIINNLDGKQYIGSSENLYVRLNEHIRFQIKSNMRLQRAISKYGLENFQILIYAYVSPDVGNLIALETYYISLFENIYNFKLKAESMLGYKHTQEAKMKMKLRFKNKLNHPFYGKSHTNESLKLISKPGQLNPMFGKKHSELTKDLISKKKSKPVEVFDSSGILTYNFDNSVKAAEFFKVFKGTIGRYIKSGKLFKGLYYIKRINL